MWLEGNKNGTLYVKYLVLEAALSESKSGLSNGLLTATGEFLPRGGFFEETELMEYEQKYEFLPYWLRKLVTGLTSLHFKSLICKLGVMIPSTWGYFL